MEDSEVEAPSGVTERHFFSSWPYDDRLCLRRLYDRYVATWVFLMQQNEATHGRKDDCSQWSLWGWLAHKLRSLRNRTVPAKKIVEFFREVIGGGVRPDEVSRKLDSLLFPKGLLSSTLDETDDTAETRDNESHPDVERDVTEVDVDAPHPQTSGRNASDPQEREKRVADASRVDGTTESPPAELPPASKRCRHESDGVADALPSRTRTVTDALASADPVDVVPVCSENDAAEVFETVFVDVPFLGNDSTSDGVVLARCDVEIQCTPESVEKEVQCNVISDILSNYIDVENELHVEVIRLYGQLLDMQEPAD